MTQDPIKTPTQLLSNSNLDPLHLSQHGSLPRDGDASGLRQDLSGGFGLSRVGADDQRQPLPDESGAGVNAHQLDKKLRRLTLDEAQDDRPSVPGQRISEYEKALASQTAKQDLVFQVVRRSEPRPDGIRLDNFPNGMLRIAYIKQQCHVLICMSRDSNAYFLAPAA